MPEKKLAVTLKTIDDAYRMEAAAHGAALVLDAEPPTGVGNDLNPMEGVLSSLAGCASMTMMASLRKKQNRHIGGMRVQVSGTLGEALPNTYERIDLHFEFVDTDATETEIQHALEMTESKLCPVWALLKGNVEVCATFSITG